MNSFNDDRLVWVDMEMSGLDFYKERILEIAVIVTDSNLEIVAEGPVLVLHQDKKLLDSMDKWNTSVHTKSGLVEKVKNSSLIEKTAEEILLNFLKMYILPGRSPLCGNTIHQDRNFMRMYMPTLEKFFHYRNLDISTIKELAKRWNYNIYKGFVKQNKHEALADIHESIEELRYYKKYFLSF
ncbi:oligoribonuclease [Candidatus Kinetoplastidibacterium desouzai]|nr:oligoribonuclease [Candidatus Kinetoplastibacterium desouzaii]